MNMIIWNRCVNVKYDIYDFWIDEMNHVFDIMCMWSILYCDLLCYVYD